MDEDAPRTVQSGQTEHQKSDRHRITQISDMYENWFLDYASYVILERAVPELLDGFKPVQRRILHAMRDLDDGRYNKVANIIGHTMKYHPHGDASIGDALVQLGQKELLIDMQGNWGNTLTGDRAAAPRYIEARLSKFAFEVVFNPKITSWKPSYDGRSKEPICFPVKFPLLLAQGVEGIAVGLASRILPHNFNELIEASIKILKNQDFEIYPDFPTGGMADCTKYNDGLRGGKVSVRAKIIKTDNKTLTITEIPYSTTTPTLIESIIAANNKGKLKIRQIEDNTTDQVEIIVHLASGSSPDQMIDALYAFTACEVSLSPYSCVIHEQKPQFLDVKEILRISTSNTLELLKKELEIQRQELLEQHLFASLEKIFIEKRIYRDIEECETWESIIETIDKGLEPYKAMFYREIVRDDIIKLTEIKIKRISRYDSFKADEIILSIEDDIKDVENNLDNLIEYAITFFQRIKQKFGKGKERKTELRNFDVIEATAVAAANVKLYVNREEGFAGTSLRKDEFVTDCSDIDDIIVFRKNGTYLITKITDKVFVGTDVIHIDIFKKNDDKTTYNVIYKDGIDGSYMVKRFNVPGVIRDKEYDLTAGSKNSTIEYFTANPNGETEILTIHLRPKPRLKKVRFDFDFTEIAIKGRQSKGNILTKNAIRKIQVKESAKPIEKAIPVWFDETTRRLNDDERGLFIGNFIGDDAIITFMNSGHYCIYPINLQTHFEDDIIMLKKYNPNDKFAAIYHHATSKTYYLKRFTTEFIPNKMIDFIDTESSNKLIRFIEHQDASVEISFKKEKDSKEREPLQIVLSEFVGIKSYKAKGKRLTQFTLKEIDVKPIEAIDISELQTQIENTNIDEITDLNEEQTSETNPKNEQTPNTINFEQLSLNFD